MNKNNMEKNSINNIGIKVGLEIHQQLATNKKLFCNCTPIESEEYPIKFQRKLRVSRSELGEFDPAALFESTKSKTIMYYANHESSCLVEQDEEGIFVAECPSLPGCVSQGKNREEALKNIKEAIELYLEPDTNELVEFKGEQVKVTV